MTSTANRLRVAQSLVEQRNRHLVEPATQSSHPRCRLINHVETP